MRRWFLLGMLVVALGCEKEGPPREPPPPARPAGSEPRIPEELRGLVGDASMAKADAAAAAGAIAELRRTKLELAPRKWSAERLAFGKGRLAQLGTDALVVRDTKDFGEVVRVPLEEPRRAVELADGSLLGVGASAVVRVDKKGKEIERYPRIPLFPESILFGDRRNEQRVWVLHSFGSLLYQYEIGGDAGGVTTLEFLDLEGFDQQAFAALKDGSFLYTSKAELRRFFPGGKRWELSLPEGPPVWRLLTTRRIDQVWIARGDGQLELAQIAQNGVRVVKSLKLERAFDIATNDKEIAVVHVENTEGKPRRWTLAVYDTGGKPRFEVELPGDPQVGAGDSWVSAVTRDKTVALSERSSHVAVGGPGWLGVWDTKTKKRVYGDD